TPGRWGRERKSGRGLGAYPQTGTGLLGFRSPVPVLGHKTGTGLFLGWALGKPVPPRDNERADAQGNEDGTDKRHEGLGSSGSRSLNFPARAHERHNQLHGGADKSDQPDRRGGVHGVLTHLVLAGQQPEN